MDTGRQTGREKTGDVHRWARGGFLSEFWRERKWWRVAEECRASRKVRQTSPPSSPLRPKKKKRGERSIVCTGLVIRKKKGENARGSEGGGKKGQARVFSGERGGGSKSLNNPTQGKKNKKILNFYSEKKRDPERKREDQFLKEKTISNLDFTKKRRKGEKG